MTCASFYCTRRYLRIAGVFLIISMLFIISVPNKSLHDHQKRRGGTAVLSLFAEKRIRSIQKASSLYDSRDFDFHYPSGDNGNEEFFRIFQYEDVDYKTYSVNASVSQHLSMDRGLPITVVEACKERKEYITSMYQVSVIIAFHNELWSDLVRSVISIINRSTSQLYEIILVDDASTLYNLGKPLDTFLRSLHIANIHVLRLTARRGLSGARMAGARYSSGNVLVFFDAHVEVNYYWLSPLLDTLITYNATIAVPVIDPIFSTDYYYGVDYYVMKGSFNWELDYTWIRNEHLERQSTTEPYPSATMAGYAFMVLKEDFLARGGYDERLHLWGADNLELSFKVWMCHGSILICPCSHVGHVFKPSASYQTPGDSEFISRTLRNAADVWMDEYTDLYYRTTGNFVALTKFDIQNTLMRKQRRIANNCNSFQWYLKSIATDVTIFEPEENKDVVYFGRLINIRYFQCLTVLVMSNMSSNSHGEPWEKSGITPLAHPTVTVTSDGPLVVEDDCTLGGAIQQFKYNSQGQISVLDNHCLTVSEIGQLYVSHCQPMSPKQTWRISHLNQNSPIRALLRTADQWKTVGQLTLEYENFTKCLHRKSASSFVLEVCKETASQLWYFSYNIKVI